MPSSPEGLTPYEKLLMDAVEALPVNSRTDIALQLQDEVVENKVSQVLSPINPKRAEEILSSIVAWAKGEELSPNRRIAGSLNLTQQDLRAVENFASLTQGNLSYKDHVLPDGSVISNRRYRDILAIRNSELQNPQSRVEWGRWVKRELRRLGPDAIRGLQQRIEDFRLIGFMPPLDVLSMGVKLEAAEEDLANLTRNGGAAAPSSLEQLALIDQLISGGSMDPQAAFQRMAGGSPAGRTMMTEYQRAFDRFRDAYLSFEGQPDKQESIVYGLVAGQIIGGSSAILPNFYSNAFKQIGRETSKHSMFYDALQFVIKSGGIGGYIPMDALFQALGSTSQEVLGFMDDAKSTHELWVEPEFLPARLRNNPEYRNDPDRPLTFKLSAREMLGVYGTSEMMSKLGINTAKDIQVFVNEMKTKEGFWTVRNNAFGHYIFHKMGYSEQEISHMFETKEFPKLRRSGDLSKVTGNEITDFWDWTGEVALDKMIIALTWIQYSRWDVEAAPLDLKRRKILSMRGVFLAAYRLGYAMGLPPEQFRNMIALFGSIPSIDRKAMIAQIQRDLSAHDDQIETLSRNEALMAKLRKNILEETTKLERPILSASRALARMAMGIGEFSSNNPTEFRERVRAAIKRMPGAGIDALRPPELWKNKWFENFEGVDSFGNKIVKNVADWRFVGNDVCQSEEQMQNAFNGIDFSVQLEDCGLRPDEIERIAHVGYEGWKNFLKYANLGVLHWSEEGYTTGDKGIRYLQKVDSSGDVTNHLMEVSSPLVPRTILRLFPPKGGHSVYSDLGSARVSMKKDDAKVNMITNRHDQDVVEAGAATEVVVNEVKEASKPFGGALSFIPNHAQQRFLQATMNIFMDGHFAHRLNSFVERLNLKEIEEGDNFGVKHLFENPNQSTTGNERNAKGELLIPKWRVDILRGEGFYSLIDINDRDQKAEIISPLAAPLPELAEAGALLDELIAFSDTQISNGGDSDRFSYLKAASKMMRKEQAFCWDTLISRRSDIPPTTLDIAMSTGENGALSGATANAILGDLYSFLGAIHPGGRVKGAKFGGENKQDQAAFVIPQLVD
ncbi:hypothetical protein HZB78_02940 [Candidatus Collierbacteria bacterium]|nr:hypothetical protein [Candidatus Collierbacteria bacterium]